MKDFDYYLENVLTKIEKQHSIVEEIKQKTLKAYAFDWDDNIQFLPSTIKLRNADRELVDEFSTEEFAQARNNKDILNKIANEGYTWDFSSFRADHEFFQDIQKATPGPSWKDFVECLNDASLFAIITARGHSVSAYKKVITKMILNNQDGINKEKVVNSIKEYRRATGQPESKLTDKQLVRKYVNQGRYYPVSNPKIMQQLGGGGGAASPEKLKVIALMDFKKYVNKMRRVLIKKIGNRETTIGFSDDDIKNYLAMKKHFGDDPQFRLKYTGKQ